MTDPLVVRFFVGSVLAIALYKRAGLYRPTPQPRPRRIDQEDRINRNAPGGSWNNKNR